MNIGLPTIALFIDFRKAFDCLQYPKLLSKVRALNFSQQVIDWLNNYLTNRSQVITANGGCSAPMSIKQGVPQGLILGPLLYILYANDIADTITKSKFTLYADDTVIYSSNKNLSKAIRDVQFNLDSLMNWCELNSIFINPNKTKYVIFSTQKIMQALSHLTLNDIEVKQVPQFI